MADVKSFKGLPLIDGQHKDVFPGSPMALVGLFTEVIRARFRDDNAVGLPWIWRPDPTPLPDETGEEDAPRTLYIESQYTEEPDARNFRPAILVEKEDTQLLKLWLGNRAAIDVPTRLQVFIAHALTPISILCLSTARGESANLGDLTFAHIVTCRDEIRATFGIHDIMPPVLGKTTIYRRNPNENETWSTPVGFQVQYKFLWRTWPVAPVLQDINARILAAGDGSFEAGVVKLALTKGRRS